MKKYKVKWTTEDKKGKYETFVCAKTLKEAKVLAKTSQILGDKDITIILEK